MELRFENIETGQVKSILVSLAEYPDYYIVIDQDGIAVGDAGSTIDEALKNAVISEIPSKIWGWKDIAYLGYFKGNQKYTFRS